MGAFGVLGGPCGHLLECVRALAGSRAITRGPAGTLEHLREPRGVPLGEAECLLGFPGLAWALLGSSGRPWGSTWELLGTYRASLGCPRAALGRSRRPCDSSKLIKCYACAGFSVFIGESNVDFRARLGDHQASQGVLRASHVTSWDSLGCCWWSCGRPWGALGDPWGHSGCPRGVLGLLLGVLNDFELRANSGDVTPVQVSAFYHK